MGSPPRARRRTTPAGAPSQTPEDPPAGLRLGLLGDLGLNAFRDTALRVGRLAEALFGAPEADVIAVNDGRVWRGKAPAETADDDAARLIALGSERSVWIADMREDPAWSQRPAVQAVGVRFCAAAPIRLKDGALVGALRVLDTEPRPYDPQLAARLEDLATVVANECDRLLGGETRMIRNLFDRAPGLMAVTRGPEHIFELANPAFRRFVGDRSMIGLPVHAALPQTVPQGFRGLLDEVYETGKPYGAHARKMLLHRAPDEPLTEAYCDFIFQPIRDDNGEVTGVFFQGHDVTAAKLAVDELAASQRELQSALGTIQAINDRSLDLICSLGPDGRYVAVNRRFEDLLGYPPGEVIGRHFGDFIHPDDLADALATSSQISDGSPTTAFNNRFVHRDGGSVPLMWSAVWSEPHQIVFAIGRDMREHEASEAKLRQAQKMEALGQLTGGVAHDFNNLLTVVLGSAEALTDGLADQPRLQPVAQLILDAAETGAELVNRLLAFSRRQSLTPKVMDSDSLFQSLLPLLRRTLGADIEIELSAEPDLRWLADPAQLTSAMLNLCINARDAMPDGGRLAVSVSRVRDDGAAGPPDAPEAGFVAISVKDSGHGMTAQTIQRVLEPFFTTKPVGKGSGLGLSMVYGFAHQSGGRLRIESEPGQGACVSIHLPLTTSLPAAETPEPDPLQDHPAMRHILLVEDDDAVRAQAETQLHALGYRVTAASNGLEALERLVDSPGIDLLMTDIVMPGGVNGRQLAGHARKLFPDLPVLFTSGYSDDAQLREARLMARAAFLPKPYRRAKLARMLHKAFENA